MLSDQLQQQQQTDDVEMNTNRLFVSGLYPCSSSTQLNECKEHLLQLIGKVCPVQDIYLPAVTITGINRGFAVVVLSKSIDNYYKKANKCIKAFNNCHWKGCKISVEFMRNSYHVSRLKREREEEEIENFELQQDYNNRLMNDVDLTIPMFQSATLNIKKGRYHTLLQISTNPHTNPTSFRSIGKDSSVVSCGKKTQFDHDGIAIADIITTDTSSSTSNSDAAIDDEEKAAAADKENNIKPSQEAAARERGGGKRKGFGTLINNIDCCIDSNDSSGGKVIAKKLYTFDNDEVDEAPCLRAEDVEDANLEKERQRQLAFIAQLFGSIYSSTTTTTTTVRSAPVVVETFANTDVLKDIFHKDEGGVWWGDDGSLDHDVQKGKQDMLFLEAEKLGLDIRDDGDEKKTMKFDFFQDDEEAVVVDVANDSHKKIIHFDSISSGKGSKHSGNVGTKDDTEIEEAIDMTPYSLADVIRSATEFCRQGNEADVMSMWRNIRVKLTADYKRKKKEAGKRIGAMKNVAGNNAVASSNAKADNVGSGANTSQYAHSSSIGKDSSGKKKDMYMNKKSRGGLKHKKKEKK